MAYIEVAWRRDALGITHIDERVQQLLGYTAGEIKALFRSAVALMPWARDNFKDLLTGPPDSIMPHTYAPCPLRHKDGHEVLCQLVAICRYDRDGCLAELFGMVRSYPCQEKLARLLDWWQVADDTGHEAVCGLAELLAAR